MSEENLLLALRAALAVRHNDEHWRLKYLEAEGKRINDALAEPVESPAWYETYRDEHQLRLQMERERDEARADVTRLQGLLVELRTERNEARAEVERLRERLQFDPGGSDKIDELEDAVKYLRTEVDHWKGAAKEYAEGQDDARAEVARLKADLDTVDSDLQLAVKRLTAEVARLTGNVRLSPDEHIAATGLYVERWCDGTTGPCAVSDSDGRHAHFRGARWIGLRALLDEFYQRGAKAMREAAAQMFDGKPTVPGLATMPPYAEAIRNLRIPEDKP